jgi:predicted MFS family arabinose efflux permease
VPARATRPPTGAMATVTATAAPRRAFLDMTVFTDWPFMVYAVAGFCGFIGLYVPFFYVQLYSLEYGPATHEFSPYLVTILNAGSVVGRIVPNYLADHLGPIPVIITVMLASSVLVFSWIGVTNLPGLIVFCVLYGITSGGVVSTNVSAIVPYCQDMSRLGNRMGMCTFFGGFSVLTGTPIGGAILGQGGPAAWRNIRVYSGTGLLVAGLLLIVSLVLHQRQIRKPASL